jgi:CheY-like chemotaxis protein
LLVDDEELARAGAADMLRELGYTVVEARSGKEALDLLNSGFKPDLLVTDYAMPGMSGAELVNRVRSMFPDMPVVMVTGYAELADEVATGYPRLSKPFRLMELASSLRNAANAVFH